MRYLITTLTLSGEELFFTGTADASAQWVEYVDCAVNFSSPTAAKEAIVKYNPQSGAPINIRSGSRLEINKSVKWML